MTLVNYNVTSVFLLFLSQYFFVSLYTCNIVVDQCHQPECHPIIFLFPKLKLSSVQSISKPTSIHSWEFEWPMYSPYISSLQIKILQFIRFVGHQQLKPVPCITNPSVHSFSNSHQELSKQPYWPKKLLLCVNPPFSYLRCVMNMWIWQGKELYNNKYKFCKNFY